MKVLKFGGTSVGTAKSILNVKQIVEANNENVIVVVSALGGITDKLILTSKLAVNGDIAFKKEMNNLIERHLNLIAEVIPMGNARDELVSQVNVLLEKLYALYEKVFETRLLTPSKEATIVSYGERISSLIASRLIEGAVWFDSLSFIKTRQQHQRHKLDKELTNRLIRKTFDTLPRVSLVPGFISTDAQTGEVTNLGRGGSDYTAAILAAALDADCLEIWTDVNGFMTADPRVIPTAIPIDELSYNEAEELSRFGAKVIYPPTIYPVWHQRIPIYIKNTMNPKAPGTIIKQHVQSPKNPIKGISFIGEATLLCLQHCNQPKDAEENKTTDSTNGFHGRLNNGSTCLVGSSLEGTANLNVSKWMNLLTEGGLSPLFINYNPVDNVIHIGIRKEDETRVCELLKQNIQTAKEWALEETKHDLSTIAIVGEKVSGNFYNQLYDKLKGEGIEVISSNLGDATITHSFMIDKEKLLQALKETHDAIFHTITSAAK